MIRLYIVYYFFVIILREVIRLTFTFPRMPRTAPADLPSQLGLDGLRPVSQTVQQGTTRADSCNTTTSAASSSTLQNLKVEVGVLSSLWMMKCRKMVSRGDKSQTHIHT